MRDGGDTGPAIVPGKPADSLLFQALCSQENQMPPDGALPPEVIADFELWILDGAFDSREDDSEARELDYSGAREFWAFQAPELPVLPQVSDVSWPRSSLDVFVLEKLEEHGLTPATPADPATLIRRLYFDLIGLPPAPEDLRAYVDSPSEEAYQAIVERLLASPLFGERQSQHWLDVVRYAETEGFEYDRHLPEMWRYRDYVVQSFAEDKPYDRFITEQLAGDELDPENVEYRIAAGFHRLGAVRRNAGNQQVASSRNEVLTERTDIVGSAMLGLTIGCCRCHDHKFDPISQVDYYRLQAYFAATQEDNVSLLSDADSQALAAKTKEIEQEIQKLKDSITGLNEADISATRSRISELEKSLPPAGPTACSIRNDFTNFDPIRVLKRGDPDKPGAIVGLRELGILVDDSLPELDPNTAHPRTRLAASLTLPNHPLTARVIVNRIWQSHFGRGIVSTTNDFGRNGSAPSHPELLDYLAQELVRSDWSTKELHRQIVLSNTYRQASEATEPTLAARLDADNVWLSHMSRRRLSAEEIRDAMLFTAGRLNVTVGGESIMVPVEQELIDQLYKPSQWDVAKDETQHYRRSIYLIAKRNLRLPFMEVFDQPAAQTSCAERPQSTHARQALEMLNGPLANELAGALVQRLHREVGPESSAMVERAFWLVAGRPPTQLEDQLSEDFLEQGSQREFCLAMFSLNAFLYVN